MNVSFNDLITYTRKAVDMRITGRSRYIETKEAILDLMVRSDYPGNKLPSEDILSKTLGISVATVREALRQLNREGYITKKHGSGNYIHHSALDLVMRIDINKTFFALLQERYPDVYSEQSDFRVGICTQEEADMLRLPEPEECLFYDRYYYVNGRELAILATNAIPAKFFTGDVKELQESDSKISLMDFIWEHCLDEMVQTAVHMDPVNATKEVAGLMNIEKGRAIVHWKEIFYNVYDLPIALSLASFNPALVDMTLLIKW